MNSDVILTDQIEKMRTALVESDYFGALLTGSEERSQPATAVDFPRLREVIDTAEKARAALRSIAGLLHEQMVLRILDMEREALDPSWYDRVGDLVKRILAAVSELRRESEFAETFGELLSCYMLTLYRSGAPGRESPLIAMILNNISRRKAIESDRAGINSVIEDLKDTVTVALISKRYAVYVLVTQGLRILFRRKSSTVPWVSLRKDLLWNWSISW